MKMMTEKIKMAAGIVLAGLLCLCAQKMRADELPLDGANLDLTAGGGWLINTNSGARVSFGMIGGSVTVTNGPTATNMLFGAISFIDHGAGVRVHSAIVSSYTIVDDHTSTITYETGATDAPAQAVVTVSDNGEPGRNVDTFSITLSDGYTLSGTLQGGNIQVNPLGSGNSD